MRLRVLALEARRRLRARFSPLAAEGFSWTPTGSFTVVLRRSASAGPAFLQLGAAAPSAAPSGPWACSRSVPSGVIADVGGKGSVSQPVRPSGSSPTAETAARAARNGRRRRPTSGPPRHAAAAVRTTSASSGTPSGCLPVGSHSASPACGVRFVGEARTRATGRGAGSPGSPQIVTSLSRIGEVREVLSTLTITRKSPPLSLRCRT